MRILNADELRHIIQSSDALASLRLGAQNYRIENLSVQMVPTLAGPTPIPKSAVSGKVVSLYKDWVIVKDTYNSLFHVANVSDLETNKPLAVGARINAPFFDPLNRVREFAGLTQIDGNEGKIPGVFRGEDLPSAANRMVAKYLREQIGYTTHTNRSGFEIAALDGKPIDKDHAQRVQQLLGALNTLNNSAVTLPGGYIEKGFLLATCGAHNFRFDTDGKEGTVQAEFDVKTPGFKGTVRIENILEGEKEGYIRMSIKEQGKEFGAPLTQKASVIAFEMALCVDAKPVRHPVEVAPARNRSRDGGR